MSQELKIRRGTTAEHAVFTGGSGEVTVDTDKDTLVVHDGLTPGGHPMASEAEVNKRTLYVASVAELEALPTATLRDGQHASVKGGDFHWDAVAVKWRSTGLLPVAAFGVDVSGESDSAQALNNAADYCRANNTGLKSSPNDIILINSPVNLRHIELDLKGTIETGFNDVPSVIIGGSSAKGYNPPQLVERVVPTNPPAYGTAGGAPGIRVIGSKGQRITVGRAYWLQVWADSDSDPVNDGSSAYSNYYLGYVNKVSWESNEATTGSLSQWINENVFYINRCFILTSTGTYQHNNNRVYGGSFEGNTANISIVDGSNNRFYDIRFEGSPTVSFGAGTRDNSIEYTWTSINQTRPLSGVSDDGVRNRVVNTENKYTAIAAIARITKESIDTTYGATDLSVDGNYISAERFTTFYKSDLIPASSELRIACKASGLLSGGFRIKLVAYDSTGTEVTGSVGNDYLVVGAGSPSFGGTSVPGTNDNSGSVVTLTKEGLSKASYVSIQVMSGADGFEALAFSAWVETPSYWGSSRNEGVDPALAPPNVRQKPRKVRTPITSATYTAGQSTSFTRTWPGIKANTVISASHGNEVNIPNTFIFHAKSEADDQVTITVSNTSSSSVTLPSGSWAHLVAFDVVKWEPPLTI